MRRAIDWREVSRRAGPGFLALAVASWAWAAHFGAERPQPDLYPFLKRAWPGADYAPLRDGSFEVSRAGRRLGWAAAGTASGYAAPLTVAVGTGADGRIRAVALLEYGDTPALMRGARPFLRSLLGKRASDAFEVGRDVDAVTGATFSSRGLARAAAQATRALDEGGASRGPARAGAAFGPAEVCLLLLTAMGAVGRNRPRLPARTRRALRVVALAGSLVTIGFLFNRPWVIAFPMRLLAGDWPPWHTHLYWYLLLGSLLLAFSRTGRNAYCPWICPFGAAQDVVGIPLGARRRGVPHPLLFTWVKRVLLWLAVLLGLLYRSPGAASYEVFAALFRLNGSGFQFALLALVLAAALFVSRPFCGWVCPVDTTEQLARFVRVRALRLAGVGPSPPPRRRPVLLRVTAEDGRPAAPVFRRLRNGLLTAAGLACALLVLGHLHARLGDSARPSPENLLGSTFATTEAAGP
jgi:uncharacterized protein with FMN-binding domain